MDAPKGKPSAILKDRARGCSRDSASVQADKEKKPGEARPFFPSGLPHGCAPQGSLHRRGEGTGADGHARGSARECTAEAAVQDQDLSAGSALLHPVVHPHRVNSGRCQSRLERVRCGEVQPAASISHAVTGEIDNDQVTGVRPSRNSSMALRTSWAGRSTIEVTWNPPMVGSASTAANSRASVAGARSCRNSGSS